MSPKKRPHTLHFLAERTFLRVIIDACENIGEDHSNFDSPECQQRISLLNEYLHYNLPARSLDSMCFERHKYSSLVHPVILLSVLIHPHMRMFKKCYFDNTIPHGFWIRRLSELNKLVVLDLNLICTDEILEVVCNNCVHLRELNAVSRVDINKSPFNASAFLRNVSDSGLKNIAKLRDLRVLYLDPPRNSRPSIKVGRFITQDGIRTLVVSLPQLEELHIESCDVGTTLISGRLRRRVLSLKTIICHFATSPSVQKLLSLCPDIQDLSLTSLSENDKDEILNQVTTSDVKLNRLSLSFFSFSSSMELLLQVKGSYLTHFCLLANNWRLGLDSVVIVGKYCPSLTMFRLISQSQSLHIPSTSAILHRCGPIFTELKSLTLGCDSFNIEDMLIFFLSRARNITKLVVEYQTKTVLDEPLRRLIKDGLLTNIEFLWLDYSLKVSFDVIKQLIDSCPALKHFVIDYDDKEKFFETYIQQNNLDIKLDNNYQIL